MPRYHFTTAHGERASDREETLDFPSDAAAWAEAVRCCGEILKDVDGKLKPNVEWRMDVNNEDDELIYSLRLIPEAYRRVKPGS